MITFTIPGAPQGKGRPKVETLRRLLDLDHSTGALRWRQDNGTRAKAGEIAGCLHAHGYWVVGVDGFKNVKAHQIVWALTHGDWPTLEVDHIDGDRANNIPSNLRLVTTAENHQNMRRARTDNKTGVLGVSKRGHRFRAQIQVAGRKKWLGEFDTIDAAKAAYIDAKRVMHPKGTL